MPTFHHQQESCRVQAFHLNYHPLLNASSTDCKKEAHTSHSARKLSGVSFQACLGANQSQCFVKFCFRLKFKPEEYLLEDVKFSHLKMFLHLGPNSALAATVNESKRASSLRLCCRVLLGRGTVDCTSLLPLCKEEHDTICEQLSLDTDHRKLLCHGELRDAAQTCRQIRGTMMLD